MNIYDAAWFFREGSGFPPFALSVTFDSPPPSPPLSPPLSWKGRAVKGPQFLVLSFRFQILLRISSLIAIPFTTSFLFL